jgi:hypothetical protein
LVANLIWLAADIPEASRPLRSDVRRSEMNVKDAEENQSRRQPNRAGECYDKHFASDERLHGTIRPNYLHAAGCRGALQLGLGLKLHFVFEAVITRQAAHQFSSLPVIENAADIFARDPGHGANIVLSEFLANDNAI